MSWPWKSTWPSRFAPSGSRPIRPRPRVDLPHPDSPTGPGVGQGPAQVVPPLGRVGRLDAEAEEPQAGQGEDRVGGVERAEHGHALHDVAEEVAAHDDAVAGSDGTRGLDVRRLLGADG